VAATAPMSRYVAAQVPQVVQYTGQPPMHQAQPVWKDPNALPVPIVKAQGQPMEMRHELPTQ